MNKNMNDGTHLQCSESEFPSAHKMWVNEAAVGYGLVIGIHIDLMPSNSNQVVGKLFEFLGCVSPSFYVFHYMQ